MITDTIQASKAASASAAANDGSVRPAHNRAAHHPFRSEVIDFFIMFQIRIKEEVCFKAGPNGGFGLKVSKKLLFPRLTGFRFGLLFIVSDELF